jgi:pyruvate formate lyase activating enzyme
MESLFCNLGNNNRVKCNVCSHHCIIKDNSYGFCNVRKNIQGKIYNSGFAKLSSINVDPIEKKPLYHFLPASLTYSIGGFGCNMRCLNCQNASISQVSYENIDVKNILPNELGKNLTNNNCQSVSWTYNEPTINLEYVLESSLIIRSLGLKNVYVSNGYMSEESLDFLLPNIDAFNIDLKFMTNNRYKKICKTNLDPILDNLKKIYKNKNHLEITNLLINDLNTSNESIKLLVDFIHDELGKEVPVHFSRFFPHYKMANYPPTNPHYLLKAKEIAIESGLDYVYLGNFNTDVNTYCPNCGELLFDRNVYEIIDKNKIKDNKCVKCNKKLNFILK